MRGNRDLHRQRRSPWASIPACAGEPRTHRYTSHTHAVYPRVCGGTHQPFTGASFGKGLSPRVRGNPYTSELTGIQQGSIPACAGEPLPPRSEQKPAKVYPRVCGGTSSSVSRLPLGRGLSPRVRGNPDYGGIRSNEVRSIPACAGEPTSYQGFDLVVRVYPRVCGGTPIPRTTRRYGQGLSPRVRGNHPEEILLPVRTRSIPACAGEPSIST